MREPTYRVENGRKIYTMESRIDCLRRAPSNPPTQTVKAENSAAEPTGQIVTGSDTDDPDVVSVHMRLITADDAYPSMGWLGPQRVKYGHNNGQAVREIVDVMTNSRRPVPLMWNHSYDSKDIAGKVNDAYWENSTDIKPGVNGWARVNRNFDPKAAVGLETGEINATSIGVVMEKERSHPEMDFDAFVSLAAEGAQVNGVDVAWLPIRCVDVVHHALVWAGADPNSGPREISNMTGETSENIFAAEAALTKVRGGIMMGEKSAVEILNSLCKDLGFDVILSEGAAIPDDLLARFKMRIDAGIEGLNRYSEIESRLSRIRSEVLPDKQTASTLETLNAVIDRLPLAKHGEAYLSDLRKEALAAFDGSKTDPANKRELTLSEKTVRGVIEAAQDTEQLKAWIAEYSEVKKEKFLPPDIHTSVNEEIPSENSKADVSAEHRRIEASFKRWKGQGGK